MYSQETIDEVKARNDIVEVIGEYVQLKRSGRSYMGLCPFHSEKTPSFSVVPDKQIYHCFGCGKSGNVISFVMNEEHVSFPQALQILADRAGMHIAQEGHTGESAQARAKREWQKRLLDINKEAALFFVKKLHTPEGQPGLTYLHGRKLSDATLQKWGLGFAPAGGSSLYRYLKEKGFSDEELKKSGLISYKYARPHDLFWNRVMFPIMDERQRVIGFGGRVMGDAKPKYLNSPETAVFDKRNHLFGIHAAARSRAGNFIICEGYMDVISLHQAGFSQAVASLGTALTEEQVKIIGKYTGSVRITYDSDGAGTRASLRAIELFDNAQIMDRQTHRKKKIETRVIRMDPYKDPDEFIKGLGADEFQKRIDTAQDSFLFQIGVLEKSFERGTPRGDTDFAESAAREIAALPSAFERREYLKSVAKEFSLREDDLKELVEQAVPEVKEEQERKQEIEVRRRLYRAERTGGTIGTAGAGGLNAAGTGEMPKDTGSLYKGAAAGRARPVSTRIPEGLVKAEDSLLSLLNDYPAYWNEVRNYLDAEDFDSVRRNLAYGAFTQLDSDGRIDVSALLAQYQTEEEIQIAAGAFVTVEIETPQARSQAVEDYVRTIKEAALRARLREVTARLDSDPQALSQYTELNTQLKNLNSIHFGAV